MLISSVDTGGRSSQRHSILVETPSSSSTDGDHENKKLIDNAKGRPKVKIRRKCLRSQSTSQLPQLNGNGGLVRKKGLILTKGMRKVHSSSSCYQMDSVEEDAMKVRWRSIEIKKDAYLIL